MLSDRRCLITLSYSRSLAHHLCMHGPAILFGFSNMDVINTLPCRSHDHLVRNASQRPSKAALRLHSPYQQLRRELPCQTRTQQHESSRVESEGPRRMRWTSYPPISPFHETFPKHEVSLTLAYVDPKAQWRLCALRLSVVSESLSRAVALSLSHRPDRRAAFGRRPGAWLSRVIREYRASVGKCQEH